MSVAIAVSNDSLQITELRRRLKAIFIGSIGNLVEWYDFYAYAAFSLYFASSFFPGNDPVVQQLNAAVLFAIGDRKFEQREISSQENPSLFGGPAGATTCGRFVLPLRSRFELARQPTRKKTK